MATGAPAERPAAAPPTVHALFVHPLKGARPVAVPVMHLDALGAIGDRRWMLVNEHGVVITPREVPRLAQLVASLPVREDGAVSADSPLTLSSAGLAPLVVTHLSADVRHRTVHCWDDALEMADAGDAAAEWCSTALGVSCRLVHMTPQSHRPLAARYAGNLPHEDRGVTVTDGAPLLVLGTASLHALNEQLRSTGKPPVSLDRFRANIVLHTAEPHIEDSWSRATMGGVAISIGSPCPRCVVTTIDPATLAQSVEPLRTLATYRRAADGKVMFGMNATHEAPGSLRVGDAVIPELATAVDGTTAEH